MKTKFFIGTFNNGFFLVEGWGNNRYRGQHPFFEKAREELVGQLDEQFHDTLEYLEGKKKNIVLGRQNTHYRMLSVLRDFFSSIHGFAFL